ncbi:MAG: hypothetical protein MI824_12705 [Hyphomicrobiales bacterium]|nr:hypothetical protein [Hyphomicrobiales bacterium]
MTAEATVTSETPMAAETTMAHGVDEGLSRLSGVECLVEQRAGRGLLRRYGSKSTNHSGDEHSSCLFHEDLQYSERVCAVLRRMADQVGGLREGGNEMPFHSS